MHPSFTPYDPSPVPERLRQITHLTNKVGFRLLRTRDNCILCSYALAHVLKILGYQATPTRVTLGIFPEKPKSHGVVIGSDGEGQRLPKASKGKWYGHLCVVAEGKWILDPTSDQSNRHDIRLPVITAALASVTPDGPTTYLNVGGCDVRYNVFWHQKGFATSPASRRSHWIDVADGVLFELSNQYKWTI
jgi:hypothetical protein